MPLCFLVVCVFHGKTQKPTKTRGCSLAKFSSFGLKTLELFRAMHVSQRRSRTFYKLTFGSSDTRQKGVFALAAADYLVWL